MIERKIKTRVDINYFKEPAKIEKNSTEEDIDERYVCLVTHKDKSYILKGFKILLEHLDPKSARSVELFKESMDQINEVYQEYFLSKAACLLNSHVAKPLSIDKVIEVAKDDRTDSYMYIEIIFEYGGVPLQSLRPTDLELTYNLMQQSADALLGLHDLGIAHFDINPLNMVYDNDKDLLKLIDLGSAFGSTSRTKLVDVTESLEGKMRSGTLIYCPPEALKMASGVQADPNLRMSLGSVDVYSWAMSFYSLFLNKNNADLKSEYRKFKLGSEADYKGFIERLKSGFDSLKPKNSKDAKIKDSIKKLLIKALSYKPKERPVMKEIVEQLKNPNKTEVKQVIAEEHKEVLEYVENYVFPDGTVYTGNSYTNQKVNLKMGRDMEKVHKYGLMVPDTKVNGRIICNMERENFGMRAVIDSDIREEDPRDDLFEASDAKIRAMNVIKGDKADGYGLTDKNTEEIGKPLGGMGTEKKFDQRIQKYKGDYKDEKKHRCGTSVYPGSSKYTGNLANNAIDRKVNLH